jgi:hypothetical protein
MLKDKLSPEWLLEGQHRLIYDALVPCLLISEDADDRPMAGMGWGALPSQLYASSLNYAIATRMLGRFKELGIKGVGVDRVKQAQKSALQSTKQLMTNPMSVASRIPKWTTAPMPKAVIKKWNEELSREFAKEISKIEIVH